MAIKTILLFYLIVGVSLFSHSQSLDPKSVKEFEARIESLRTRYHIPGLSVGIVLHKELVWKKGFGYADIESKIVPDENTIYQIASVSKTFGSILLLQQVEAGKISLDDPVTKYGINLGARWGGDSRIKIKHLLTHTAMGGSFNGFKPGRTFRYNGDWYGRLKPAIEEAAGKSYGALLVENIIRPTDMLHTAPSLDDSLEFQLAGYDRKALVANVAKPYDWYKHAIVPVKNFRYSFGPAAGIMSSVSDLALYSNAIDEKKFLKQDTWESVFTPFVTEKGKTIQYGLGWFVTYYKGEKLLWHTGWWTGYSALFLKVPSKDITFIILANSQDLSRPFYHIVQLFPGFAFPAPFASNLNSKITASAFAKEFLERFVE